MAESRRWKEAVAHQTRGHSDDIQRRQVSTFFSKARAPATPAEMRHGSGQAAAFGKELPDEYSVPNGTHSFHHPR